MLQRSAADRDQDGDFREHRHGAERGGGGAHADHQRGGQWTLLFALNLVFNCQFSAQIEFQYNAITQYYTYYTIVTNLERY